MLIWRQPSLPKRSAGDRVAVRSSISTIRHNVVNGRSLARDPRLDDQAGDAAIALAFVCDSFVHRMTGQFREHMRCDVGGAAICPTPSAA